MKVAQQYLRRLKQELVQKKKHHRAVSMAVNHYEEQKVYGNHWSYSLVRGKKHRKYSS